MRNNEMKKRKVIKEIKETKENHEKVADILRFGFMANMPFSKWKMKGNNRKHVALVCQRLVVTWSKDNGLPLLYMEKFQT